MYTGYFGLSEVPFSIAPNPDYLFMSERHKEALAHLQYGLGETGGFVLLTGEVGTGKTTVSRCLLSNLPEHTQVAFILNPTLSSQELLATICDELKIRYRKTGATLKTLTDKIQQKLIKNHEAGLNTVLIIDEAQHLRAEVLEQLRLLTNLETNTKKLLQVILIGQPELQQLLQRQDLRQLAQRITARYHLLALTKPEVSQYISHRLSVANCKQPLFSPKAIAKIHQISKGIPRVINLLCDRALLGAYGANQHEISAKMITQSAQEALGAEYHQASVWSKWGQKGLIVALILVVIALASVLLIQAFKPIDTASTTQSQVNSEPLTKVLPSELIPLNQNLAPSVSYLFDLWRIKISETIEEPCKLAAEFQLSCFWYKGNINELARYNLPAVLKFYSATGQAFYGVFAGIHRAASAFDSTFDIRFIYNAKSSSETIVTVDQRWLADFWRGGALLFWQGNKNSKGQFVSQLTPESEPAQWQWLEQQLSRHQHRPERTITTFDSLLQNQLHQFQREHGVATEINGIISRDSLILLSNQLDSGLPVFTNESVQ